MQRYGSFEDNVAIGTFRHGFLHGYGVPPPGEVNPLVNFKVDAYAASGKGLITLHTGSISLINPHFTASTPGNVMVRELGSWRGLGFRRRLWFRV